MVYRKQLSSGGMPTVRAPNLSQYMRDAAKQTQEQGLALAKQSEDIYTNEFTTLSSQQIKEAYDRNPNDPSALQAELGKVRDGLAKSVQNEELRGQLEMKFNVAAQPFVNKAEDIFTKAQREKQQGSIMGTYETTRGMLEDMAGNMFNKDRTTATNTSLAVFQGITDVDKMLMQTDDRGLFLVSNEKRMAMTKRLIPDAISAGTRNHFDTLDVDEKIAFLENYKTGRAEIFLPDPQAEDGFAAVNLDKFLDREDYEKDLSYMEGWQKEYTSEMKYVLAQEEKQAKAILEAEEATAKAKERLQEEQHRAFIRKEKVNEAYIKSVERAERKKEQLEAKREKQLASLETELKEAQAAQLAPIKNKTKFDLTLQKKSFAIEKGKATERNTIPDFLTYMNNIDEARGADLIKDNEELSYKEGVAEAFVNVIEEQELGEGYVKKHWFSDDEKSVLANGVGLLDGYMNRMGKTNVGLRADMYKEYFNELQRQGVDMKSYGKDDITKSKRAVLSTISKYAEGQYPMFGLHEGVVNKVIGGQGIIPITEEIAQIKAKQRVKVGDYNREIDDKGVEAWVLRGSDGSVIDIKRVK